MPHKLISAVTEIVGPGYCSDSDFATFACSNNSSQYPSRVPGMVVRPGNTDEVSRIVKLANQDKVPVVPRGGACSYGGWPEGEPGESICIDLTRMRRILDFNPVNKTVTVEAGITGSEIETRMRAEGFCVHTIFSPSDSVTVGGMICGESGAAAGRDFSSAGMDWLFTWGLKVVLPNGDIIQTGSGINPQAKNHSRVSSGPDLTGLFIGSMGVFGIVTEVTMQLFHLQPYEATGSVAFDYGHLDDAHRAMAAIDDHEPKLCAILAMFGPGPVIPEGQDWVLIYRVTGFTQDEVDRKLGTIARILREVTPSNKGPTASSEKMADFYINRMHDSAHGFGMWFMIESLAPRDQSLRNLKASFEWLKNELAGWERRVPVFNSSLFAQLDGDVVSYHGMVDLTDEEAREKAMEVQKGTLDMLLGLGGNVIVLSKDLCDVGADHFRPECAAMLRTMKAALDPNNIMNPHIFKLP
ncbi:MAG: FAD-binding oxidoreductase [Dehalococcoidia bacterium]